MSHAPARSLRRLAAALSCFALAALLPAFALAQEHPQPKKKEKAAPAAATPAPAATAPARATASVGAAAGAATAAGDISGAPIVKRYVEAIGGVEAISKVRTFKLAMTLEMPAQNLKGTVEAWRGEPDTLYVKTVLPGIGNIEQGWNGTVGWSIDPIMGARLLDGGELDQLKQQGSDLLGYADLANHFLTMEAKGKVTFEGQETDAVRLVTKEGVTMTAYYDPATALQVGMDMVAMTAMGEVPTKTILEDYKEFAGIKTPTMMRQFVMGMEQRIGITDMQVNPKEMPSFALPEAIKALLPAN